jgi:hypothetical protein
MALAAGSAGPVLPALARAADGGVPAAASTGRPICVRVGTRSEGWAWPSGRFIHWAKCRGVVPECRAGGSGSEVEGWYANGVLIAPDRCHKGSGKQR